MSLQQKLLGSPTLIPRSFLGLRVALLHAAFGAFLVILFSLARAPIDPANRSRVGGGAALAAQAALAATSRTKILIDGGAHVSAAASGAAARRVAALAALSDALAEEGDVLRAELQALREVGKANSLSNENGALASSTLVQFPPPVAPELAASAPAVAPFPPIFAEATTTTTFSASAQSADSCVSAPLPQTKFVPISRGFACFENVYAYGGRVKLLLPSQPEQALLTFLERDAADAKIEVLTDAEISALTRNGPLPSVASAHLLFEWTQNLFFRHHFHFAEAMASHLFLAAATDLPAAEIVLICGHPAKRHDDGLNGQNGLNALVAAAVWAGAPLARCEEVNGTSALSGDGPSNISPSSEPPAWEWSKADLERILPSNLLRTPQPLAPPSIDWCTRSPGPLPRGRLPWAMHISRACTSDRKAAHREHATVAQNNVNAGLVALISTKVQEGIEKSLSTQMRASPLIAAAEFAADARDLTGVSIAAILSQAAPAGGEPLIVAIQRSNRRNFRDDAFAALVALLRAKYSTRVLAVRMELLTPRQQLRLSSLADIFVGAHGMGLCNLLWQKRGSGVLEIFPHVSISIAQRASQDVQP